MYVDQQDANQLEVWFRVKHMAVNSRPKEETTAAWIGLFQQKIATNIAQLFYNRQY